MDINVWSKVKVAVQSAIAAAIEITAISKANPAVATSAAHGKSVGEYLLLKVVGMQELHYRVVRIGAVTTDTFTLVGIDSTAWDDFVSGTAEELTFGSLASTLQSFSVSGGEAAAIGVNTIHVDQDYEIPGNRTPIVIASNSLWVPGDPALVAMNGFDAIKTPGGILITFATGVKVAFAAFMSCNLAPQGEAGQAVTTPVGLRLRGLMSNFPN